MGDTLAQVALVLFLVTITVLGFVRRDVSVTREAISDYLSGDYAPLAVAAFVVLAAGTGWKAIASHRAGRRVLSGMLAVYSVAVLVAGFTQPGQTVHDLAAVIAFATVPVAAGYLARHGSRASLWWLVAILASFLAWPVLGFGTGERLTVLLEVAWLLSLRPGARAGPASR